MINIDCLKSVLEKEDFENKGNKYKHVFEDGKKIEVDFSKKEIFTKYFKNNIREE